MFVDFFAFIIDTMKYFVSFLPFKHTLNFHYSVGCSINYLFAVIVKPYFVYDNTIYILHNIEWFVITLKERERERKKLKVIEQNFAQNKFEKSQSHDRWN